MASECWAVIDMGSLFKQCIFYIAHLRQYSSRQLYVLWSISQKVYEPVIGTLSRFFPYFILMNKSGHIFGMSRQLKCRSMCKLLHWSDHYLACRNKISFSQNWDIELIISGVLCQKQVSRAGTSNYIPQILWDVITCPCPWYLLLVKHSTIIALWNESWASLKAILLINTCWNTMWWYMYEYVKTRKITHQIPLHYAKLTEQLSLKLCCYKWTKRTIRKAIG